MMVYDAVESAQSLEFRGLHWNYGWLGPTRKQSRAGVGHGWLLGVQGAPSSKQQQAAAQRELRTRAMRNFYGWYCPTLKHHAQPSTTMACRDQGPENTSDHPSDYRATPSLSECLLFFEIFVLGMYHWLSLLRLNH